MAHLIYYTGAIFTISTDEFNQLKHKEAYHSYEHHKYISDMDTLK